ncbi:phosphate ABC transporter substrate-binding protein PstS [Roseateles sp. DB2]|uniref:phosphate ABC transporter substrate-binding protein PstS n=1 Tax=Roseateles sp. DB2 TaxID=3453717 RepID=UPI003EE9F989
MSRALPLPQAPRLLRRHALRAAVLGALLPALGPSHALADVQGVGASFPSVVYQAWTEQYARAHGRKVRYKPTGSGDGQKQIQARTVDFAGSDVPFSAADLASKQLVQLPMLVGGIVPAVNLKGVSQLRLDGNTLADIFRGEIRQWNHPRIAALNPGVTLPALPITRVVRKDKSGSTDAFSRYLSLVSPAFREQVGAGMLPKWPEGALAPVAAEGNDGIAQAIKATPGAISYVSFDRLHKAQLNGVLLRNAEDSDFVAASEAGFREAVRNSSMGRAGDESASLLQRPGKGAWPITVTSYILVDARPKSAAAASEALHFINWTLQSGDRLLADTGFAPLPVAVQARMAARIASVRAQDGGVINYY